MLGSVPVKLRQRLLAGGAYFFHFFPPRIGPLSAGRFGHGASGFVVSCDGGKVGVQEFLTIVTQHRGVLKKYTLRFQRAQCD
jgi:hypothetical protein